MSAEKEVDVLWKILETCRHALMTLAPWSGVPTIEDGPEETRPSYWIATAREARAALWELKDFAI